MVRRRLTWKPGDDVGPDRGVGQRIPQRIDHAAIVVAGVGAAHRAKHRVARMLERKMKVRNEPPAARDQVDQPRLAIHRLERTDAKPAVHRQGVERLRERLQRRAGREIATVRPEMYTREHNLLDAVCHRRTDASEDVVERAAAAMPARAWNDAVGASLVAAGLHREHLHRPARRLGLECRSTRPVARPAGQ